MSITSFHKDVIKYAKRAKELPFYTNRKGKQPRFLQGAYRFNIIYKYMRKHLLNGAKWIDFGPYPGHYQAFIEDVTGTKCRWAGLGFDKKLKDYFKGHEFYNMDFEKPVKKNAKLREKNDISTGFNIIEHLNYPNRMLDQMNYCTKMDGLCIVVTDNISKFWGVLSMVFKGGSPLDHLINSCIFYNGVFRPHVRLYSKKELEFLLNYSGFKVIDHYYFDIRSMQYANRKLKRKPTNVMGKVQDFVNALVPHFRDHQIIIGKKVVAFDELDKLRPLPTDNEEEIWKVRNKWWKRPIFKKTGWKG